MVPVYFDWVKPDLSDSIYSVCLCESRGVDIFLYTQSLMVFKDWETPHNPPELILFGEI